ncbi:Gfo/Idh/MocA family oxidoreductase [Candidatus Margulisiibacteriota bacterium]
MIKICVLGAGKWGKNHVRTLHQLGNLGGIIETDPGRAGELKKQYKDIPVYSSLVQPGALDYDAYTIAVPAEYHYEKAKFLLENNKHVLVEKPITLNSQEARELNQIAAKNKLVLMVGHLLIFHPAINKIKELIDSGKIGKVQYIYGNRLNLGTVRKEENILWSFAPHDISIFQYLLNSKPLEITSKGGAHLQAHIHDTTMTILRYPNNIIGHIFVSWLHPFKEHRLVVIGDKGMLCFEDSSPEKELLYYEKGIDWVKGDPIKRDGPTATVVYGEAQPLEQEMLHFLACIQGKARNTLISGEKGLEVLEILEEAERSLNDEQPLKEPVNKAKEKEQKQNFFVHQTAVVDDNVEIGEGTKIWHFSHVQPNAKIGKKCIFGQNVNIANNVKIGNFVKIQNNVSVYEGVELEDYVFCGPSMVFTNIMVPRSKYPQAHSKFYSKTLIKEGSSIGANATIVCGITLGKFSFIGAGAVVIKDVPDFAIVVGNPSRIVGWMSEGGTRLEFNKENKAYCEKSKKWYLKEDNLVKELNLVSELKK